MTAAFCCGVAIHQCLLGHFNRALAYSSSLTWYRCNVLACMLHCNNNGQVVKLAVVIAGRKLFTVCCPRLASGGCEEVCFCTRQCFRGHIGERIYQLCVLELIWVCTAVSQHRHLIFAGLESACNCTASIPECTNQHQLTSCQTSDIECTALYIDLLARLCLKHGVCHELYCHNLSVHTAREPGVESSGHLQQDQHCCCTAKLGFVPGLPLV